jgi:hypothetical protein
MSLERLYFRALRKRIGGSRPGDVRSKIVLVRV